MIRARWPAVAWLTLVWVLLWGTFTPLTLIGGVLAGLVVTALFPVPAATSRLRIRPLRLLGLAGFLVYDLAVSGVEVSWQVLRHGPRARGAILALPLQTTSDLVVAVLAAAYTLSPGTTVLQIDRERAVWYVYALGPRDRAGAERARARAADMQRRVLAAIAPRPEAPS